MVKVISKEYFTHILLGRLETQDRKSDSLRYFRPTFFKKLYRLGENNFVNDILVPHIQNLKIYYNHNEIIKTISFKEIDNLTIEDELLYINLKGKKHQVVTPISDERNIKNKEQFIPLEITKNDLSFATIDHSPSLLELTKKHKNDYSIIFSYYKGVRSNAEKMNDKLIVNLTDEQKDLLWVELVDFFNNTTIEIVHTKYNNKK